MVTLLPRLSGPVAERMLYQFLRRGPSGWLGFRAGDLPDGVRFAATGGSPATSAQLGELRSGLLDIAGRNGFGSTATRPGAARFDAEAAAWLADCALLDSGEALRDDVWTFIAVTLAPDIVNWRFGGARARYLGGVRNTFQRLWMRARALDRGKSCAERWGLLEELSEDALVQISERPSIGGDPVLARELAEAWVRASRHHGKGGMEPIMRRAALRVRILNEIRSLSTHPSAEIRATLDAVFDISPGAGLHWRPGDKPSSHAQTKAGDKAETPEDPSRVRSPMHSAESASADRRLLAAKVEAEALRRGWLSPKSKSALEKIRSGSNELSSTERSTLKFLLERLRTAVDPGQKPIN